MSELLKEIIDLGTYSNSGYAEHVVQSKYLSILTQLRSVGHILQKTDCSEEPLKEELSARWNRWKGVSIFKDFIEPGRNALMKEGGDGLRLRGDPNVHFGGYADPGKPGESTTIVFFEPDRLTDCDGRLVMPLLKESISFWDNCLREIEAVRPR